MKINLHLKYPARLINEVLTPAHLTLNVLHSAVGLAYSRERNRSMTLQESRMWAKIQDRLMDEDGKPLPGDIELSDEQFEFLFKAIQDGQYPPEFAVPISLIHEYLERVKIGKEG